MDFNALYGMHAKDKQSLKRQIRTNMRKTAARKPGNKKRCETHKTH